MLYGLIGAVEYIPVGLTILVFFTFPPIIAAINFFVLRDSVTGPKVAAVAIAFLGLVLMLGVSVQSVDLRGVGLALMAAIATAWHAVWLGRKLTHVDGVVVMFYMSVVATVILFGACVGGGFVQWPTTDLGWIGLAGVIVLQGTSVNLYYQVILWVGALKSSIITNIQPLAAILAAWILFDEVLTPLQFLGGALVLGGILYMQWSEARGRR
jgi:drug/metabolite transporter (DMT)-like permease